MRVSRMLGLALLGIALGKSGIAQTTLRVVPSADISELDPTRGSNLVSRIYAQMVFDTLFALDGKLAPQPMMVESTEISPDRLTYRFTLRPGLRFHDGSPVTTADVIASLERWMHNTSIGNQLAARTASLSLIDDRRFSLVLRQPFELVEFMLAGPGAPIAAIMRESDAKRPVGSPLPQPIGSGPFRFVAPERQEGARAVFERNPDYISRTEPPDGLAGARVVKVDRVEWIVMPDATTAANALVTGQVDFWEGASPDLLGYLKQRGLVVRRNNALPSVAFVRPNFQHKLFADVRARQALALLVDQDEMMQAFAAENAWTACRSFSVCGSPLGSEAGSEPYRKPDVVRAKTLLAEAGYNGEKLVLLGTPTLAPINAMTQVLAKRLQDAGVAVDVQMTDFATMLQCINAREQPGDRGGWDLFAYYAVGSSWFHPLMNVAIDLSCAGRNWPGFPCDAAGEALRQDFLNAANATGQKARFEILEKHLWQVLPYIPAGQFDVVNSYRPTLKGVLDAYFLPYWNIEK